MTSGSLYTRRRTAPEALFAESRLSGALALCQSTTDPAAVRE